MYFNTPAKNQQNHFYDYQILTRYQRLLLIFTLLFFGISFSYGAENDSLTIVLTKDSDFLKEYKLQALTISSDSVTSTTKHTRLVSAILAFPVPFGLFGGHRLYLGTKPYIPFVYIATLGGCFGILPLIDFIAILTSGKENFARYKNNGHVFMWSK